MRIGRLWADTNERQITNHPASSYDTPPEIQHKNVHNNNTSLKKTPTTHNDSLDVMQSSAAAANSVNPEASNNNFSRELKRIRDARYKQLKRLMQTDEQKEQQRERKRMKYSTLTAEQRESRRRRDCERRRLRWQSLTPDVRSERRARASMKARERRLRMTSEQKERKKTRDRENARQRRLRKKVDQQPTHNQNSSTSNNTARNVDNQSCASSTSHYHVPMIGPPATNGVVSLSDVSWLNLQQPTWMNIKMDPEDFSHMHGMQRRF